MFALTDRPARAAVDRRHIRKDKSLQNQAAAVVDGI